MSAFTTNRFSRASVIPYFSIVALFLLWMHFGVEGLRRDHFILIASTSIVYFYSELGRKLALGCAGIILYWIIFDSVRAFPNYEYTAVHIGDLYQAEKSWFGIQSSQGLITANEYFGIHNHTFFDIYSAIIYICWIPVPFIFGLYLFFANKRVTMVHFWFAFLLVGLLGLVFQYIYPAAAPWYVELYGADGGFQKVLGNPGRLINFDHFFGVDTFSNMYSLNANVYAAMPSKHCAFPIIALFFAITARLRWWIIGFSILMISTWFSAVYSNHHYIMDVIAGIGIAILTLIIYKLLLKTRVKYFLDNYGNKLF